MEEIKIDIFGRVQGVMFRHFVKENADRLGVKGYVKNRDDGAVSIVAQADRKTLENFLKISEKGPRLARVSGVSYMWKRPEVKQKNFIIALDKGVIEDQKSSLLNLGKNMLNIGRSVPKHVAIIPDGNRRWAKEKGLNPAEGHKKSTEYENLVRISEEAERLGVKYISFWAFSTENWKRSRKEIETLFNLIFKIIEKFEKYAKEKGIRFRHLGRKDRIPKKVLELFNRLEKETENFDNLNMQLCIDYGGRDEIARAVNKILKSGVNEIHEDDFVNYLDSAGIPDPDLMIRTSGEHRMSGFMAFQSAYSEFYFTEVNFPDFGPEELRKAVEDFSRRKRNFGK